MPEDLDEIPPDYEVDDPFPRGYPPEGESERHEEFDELHTEFADGIAEVIEEPHMLECQDNQPNLANRNLEYFLSGLQISETSSEFFQTEVRSLYGIQNSSPNQSGCQECLKIFRFKVD